eukprot:GDKI01042676.1.p1 GENE.GDKI01042676.1~~GDKI01042676.1.p1  ORF type:complete len:165 (-),score=23.40 GDKI01042676.1:128-622(-)
MSEDNRTNAGSKEVLSQIKDIDKKIESMNDRLAVSQTPYFSHLCEQTKLLHEYKMRLVELYSTLLLMEAEDEFKKKDINSKPAAPRATKAIAFRDAMTLRGCLEWIAAKFRWSTPTVAPQKYGEASVAGSALPPTRSSSGSYSSVCATSDATLSKRHTHNTVYD